MIIETASFISMVVGKKPCLAVEKAQTVNQPESIFVSAEHAKMCQGLKGRFQLF